MERLILMTGVTGHSGRYAVERLEQRKNDTADMRFRALVRGNSDVTRLQNSPLAIELHYGDIRDAVVLQNAMQGVDTLLHIVGILDSVRVMEAAIKAGVRRAILVHTTGIYSKYKSASREYLAVDAQVERMAENAGISLTILRPTMIYGDVDDQNVITFIRMMDRLPFMPVVNGARFLLQPVHRRDLGHAYADVLLDETATLGKNYVLSGKEPIELRDMLTIIAQYLDKKPKFFSLPYWFAIAGAWALYLLSLTKVDYREKVQRLVEPRAYPHDEASRDFGYAPMDFAAGVKDEVAAYLAARDASRQTKA